MATFPSILVLSFLLVATVPLSHAVILNGTQIAEAQIAGRVFCTASGNLETGSNSTGAVGVNVGLICDGNQNIVAGATTNTTGGFLIIVNAPELASITNITNCTVEVSLPLVNCSLTPIVGRLAAEINLLEVITAPILGAVARFVIGLFCLVF